MTCQPEGNRIDCEAEKRYAISTLEEYNRWRRGEGEYQWNENPSKNKRFAIPPAEIGKAIEYAVEYMRKN